MHKYKVSFTCVGLGRSFHSVLTGSYSTMVFYPAKKKRKKKKNEISSSVVLSVLLTAHSPADRFWRAPAAASRVFWLWLSLRSDKYSLTTSGW